MGLMFTYPYEERLYHAGKADAYAARLTKLAPVALYQRPPIYLRYLLLGLMNYGKVGAVRDFLRYLPLQGHARYRWLNEVEHDGGSLPALVGRTTNTPRHATFLTAALGMATVHGWEAAVKVLGYMMRAGVTVWNGRMDMPNDAQGDSALMMLCDKTYAAGIPQEIHRALIKEALEWGARPFVRAGFYGRASAYERLWVYFGERVDVMPPIPLTADGYTNERVVERGLPVEKDPHPVKPHANPYYDSPFKWRPSEPEQIKRPA